MQLFGLLCFRTVSMVIGQYLIDESVKSILFIQLFIDALYVPYINI